MILHASAWGKRQRTRAGRVPDAGRTLEFEQTDADRTRACARVRTKVDRSLSGTQTEYPSSGDSTLGLIDWASNAYSNSISW
eukprot:gene20263-biopygen14620